MTKTSQISPFSYEEFLKPLFEEGHSVLCLCLSGGLSASYNSALLARESLEEQFPGQKFYPVDTLSATGGVGVLTERALRNRANGMSLEENYQDLVSATKKIRHWFLVQDLMYLKRGGRISAATAVVGTALKIKPILCINPEGKLDTIAKKRGDKLAANHILDLFTESYDPTSGDVIYILDADAPQLGDYLETEVKRRFPDAEVRHTPLCPVIGSHTGPGMAAITHMGK